MMSPDDVGLRGLLGRLSLERKVLLLTGQDFWSTWPLPEIGLRSVVFSDGPSGVRGVVWDERDPSLNLPSGTALGATWDRTVAERYGGVLAVEARRKQVDVVLGPTINLHRSPLGGRHFEAFSEDPLLTGELAAAYIAGLQRNGVAATPKHYVANEAETDRFTADSVVSVRALRELYLRAFERTVVDSRSWALMSAYNSINGVTASENDLLTAPLRSEWGFDGVVVSDWTAVRSVAAANADQDLAMPGPDGAWGPALVAAVRGGIVAEAAIDTKVLRVLRLAARVGALRGFEPDSIAMSIEDGPSFAREVEGAAIVPVQNDGLLPLRDRVGLRIAVIGHNATVARTSGGGSATVVPEYVVSPLQGIRDAYPLASVSYEVGAIVQQGLAGLPLTEIVNPVTGQPGVHVRFLDETGAEIYVEDRRATELIWLGSGAPISRTAALELVTTWTPRLTENVRWAVATTGTVTVEIDGLPFWATTLEPSGDDLAMALLAPSMGTCSLTVEGGRSYNVRVRLDRVIAATSVEHAMSLLFGLAPSQSDEEQLLARAEAAAAAADVVMLVVGTNSEVESEGFDRADLSLPGRQDALATRVLAANPQTIVVVNSGAPVVLPWRESAAAVLLTWFGGQEYGRALADVLTGDVEPGGRLPTTWPDRMEDVPVLEVAPKLGVVRYDEEIHVGYRAWMKAAATPAWPFGFGLGYSVWTFSDLQVPTVVRPGMPFSVRVLATNTGGRASKQVVQVYSSRPNSSIDRPSRWLVGFESITADSGESTVVEVRIPPEAFAHWANGDWAFEDGPFLISVAFHSMDAGVQRIVELRSDGPPVI